VLRGNQVLMFRLTCRKFIEAVKAHNKSTQPGGAVGIVGSSGGGGGGGGGGGSETAATADGFGRLLLLGQELQIQHDALEHPQRIDSTRLKDAYSLLAYVTAKCLITFLPVRTRLRFARVLFVW
jgi:hypothetical protein